MHQAVIARSLLALSLLSVMVVEDRRASRSRRDERVSISVSIGWVPAGPAYDQLALTVNDS